MKFRPNVNFTLPGALAAGFSHPTNSRERMKTAMIHLNRLMIKPPAI
jgi:hypothetical protein